jgi:glycosyltransferase involved in cell wall biosynthesis
VKRLLVNIYYRLLRIYYASEYGRKKAIEGYFRRWETEGPQYAARRNAPNKKEKPRLFWGSIPLISNKYWSNAMRQAGFESYTVMAQFYSAINAKSDFDMYLDEIPAKADVFWLFKEEQFLLRDYNMLDFILKNYDVFHISTAGILPETSPLKSQEARLLKLFGCKVILMPYGGDYYVYSEISDNSLKNALLKSYPGKYFEEDKIRTDFRAWSKAADAVITGSQLDSVGRWDVLPCNFVTIDTDQWQPKKNYSDLNGINGYVNIVHTPNHRGFKGSEFIIHAVEELKREGLKVNLILVEGKKNAEVKKILEAEADILAEQIIATGYAMSGIEGMATGLPVLSNLSNEYYVRVLRRYSYLNECPILSSTPENIKHNLRILVQNPELRKQLGIAGRKFAEKYHSAQAAQFLFGQVYEKIWFGKEVDLMNLYHPLNAASYNNKTPYIEHPLTENKIIGDPHQNLKTQSLE